MNFLFFFFFFRMNFLSLLCLIGLCQFHACIYSIIFFQYHCVPGPVLGIRAVYITCTGSRHSMLLLLLLSRSAMSDSVRPHRRQPTRLCRPWDSPGKNTGVGCHFLLQCMKVISESEVRHSTRGCVSTEVMI